MPVGSTRTRSGRTRTRLGRPTAMNGGSAGNCREQSLPASPYLVHPWTRRLGRGEIEDGGVSSVVERWATRGREWRGRSGQVEVLENLHQVVWQAANAAHHALVIDLRSPDRDRRGGVALPESRRRGPAEGHRTARRSSRRQHLHRALAELDPAPGSCARSGNDAAWPASIAGARSCSDFCRNRSRCLRQNLTKFSSLTVNRTGAGNS